MMMYLRKSKINVPVGCDYLYKEIQVRNKLENYIGCLNSTVKRLFSSLETCEVAEVQRGNSNFAPLHSSSVFPKLLLNLIIFSQLCTSHLYIFLHLLLSKLRRWDVYLCIHFLQIFAFLVISFLVCQFPRFYWAAPLPRWEELMKTNISLVLSGSAAINSFKQAGDTIRFMFQNFLLRAVW